MGLLTRLGCVVGSYVVYLLILMSLSSSLILVSLLLLLWLAMVLPFGIKRNSWRLESCLWGMGDKKASVSRSPTGPCLASCWSVKYLWQVVDSSCLPVPGNEGQKMSAGRRILLWGLCKFRAPGPSSCRDGKPTVLKWVHEYDSKWGSSCICPFGSRWSDECQCQKSMWITVYGASWRMVSILRVLPLRWPVYRYPGSIVYSLEPAAE